MASTLDRFRFRFPSELGWAPGKFRLLFVVPPSELPPELPELPELDPPLPRSGRTKSLEGFGVP